MTVWVPPDASEVVVHRLRELFAARSDPLLDGVRVSTELGTTTSGPPSLPWVLVGEDGSTWSWPGPVRATVRISVWHETDYRTKRVCALALALLVAETAHRGFPAAQPVAGVESVPDPYTGQPLATCSLALWLRPVREA